MLYPVWVTSSGRKVPVRTMTDMHLANACAMMQRRWESHIAPVKTRKLLEMLWKELERRRKAGGEMKNKAFKGPNWCVVGDEEIAHFVEATIDGNGLARLSLCGISCQSKKNPWRKASSTYTEKRCPACVDLIKKGKSTVAMPENAGTAINIRTLLLEFLKENRSWDKLMEMTDKFCGDMNLPQVSETELHAVLGELIRDDLVSYETRGKHMLYVRVNMDSIPENAKEHRVNFMQVVGPDIPLCWIPVDDVKAVVMLLAVHQPKSESLEIVKAQFEATIGHLNKYIDEAIERNNRSALGMVATWTHAGEKEKKKK